jgi:hypothetical protein
MTEGLEMTKSDGCLQLHRKLQRERFHRSQPSHPKLAKMANNDDICG